jgi:hypothetical protein
MSKFIKLNNDQEFVDKVEQIAEYKFDALAPVAFSGSQNDLINVGTPMGVQLSTTVSGVTFYRNGNLIIVSGTTTSSSVAIPTRYRPISTFTQPGVSLSVPYLVQMVVTTNALTAPTGTKVYTSWITQDS